MPTEFAHDTSAATAYPHAPDTLQLIGRKHVVAYLGPGIVVAIGLLLLAGGPLLGFIGVIVLGIGVNKILHLRAARWIVTADGVSTRVGWLPWRRGGLFVPVEHVYEAYYHRSFLGHYFGFGDLSLRRSDGTTTTLAMDDLAGADDICGEINALVRERHVERRAATHAQISLAGDIHRTMHAHALATTSVSAPLQALEQLAGLRERGALSEEEFAREKARLLNA